MSNEAKELVAYLSKAELKDVIPTGKKIRRDTRWNPLYRNYFIGIRPPEEKEILTLPGDVFWYDLAADVVRVARRVNEQIKWLVPKDKIPPRLAFNTKDQTLVGFVEDEPQSTEKQNVSMKEFLSKDIDL